jgi:hypothetical protein
MENKYYTPKIEEFHIGFEYEAKVYGKDYYIPLVFKPNDYETLFDKRILSISGQQVYEEPRFYVPDTFRVKYLDREDIEKLGWKYSGNVEGGLGFYYKEAMNKEARYIMYHVPVQNRVEIIEDDYNIFDGFIKNKSELRRVMEMVGIETE